MKTRESKPLTPEQKELVSRNQDLAQKYVEEFILKNQIYAPQLTLDDLLGENYLLLCYAAQDYKPEKDGQFPEYFKKYSSVRLNAYYRDFQEVSSRTTYKFFA